MQATRRMRLQSVIQEELSHIVPREIKDPRIPAVTFTAVEVSQDGGQATVFVSILGGTQEEDEESPSEPEKTPQKKSKKTKMKECLEGLSSASGFLRRHLGKVLNVRHIPSLIFREDRGFENAIRVHEILKKISDTSSS